MRPVKRRFDHTTGGWKETAEQGYYLVQTWWESEQAFWDWTRSESFRLAHSDRPPADMFAAPSSLEIHEVVLSTAKNEAAQR
jgi:heme-degrading monooxygenase HmoA